MTREDSIHKDETENLNSNPIATSTPVSSPETFFSLFKPVKSITENVRARAMALVGLVYSGVLALSLPSAPFIDALRSQFDQGKLAVEKIKTADHESAHFLLSILNYQPMVDVWLNPHGQQVAIALSLPAGAGSFEHASSNSFRRSFISQTFGELVEPLVLDASKLTDEQIARQVFMLLAGDAMNAYDENKEGVGEKFMENVINIINKTTDAARVKGILQTTKYKNLANSVSDLLVNRIVEFLKDPGVRKVVDIFSVKLLESGHIHKKGESIVPMMMGLLEENGVSKEEFEGFQKKYDEMVKATVAEMRGLVEE